MVEAEPPRLLEAAQLWSEINFGNPTDITIMTSLMSADAQAAFAQWATAAAVLPDGDTFVDALQRRSAIASEWATFFDTYDLWLTATSTEPAFEVGADLASPERVTHILNGLRVVMATNSLGLPSAVVPIGTCDGLPQSVQIIGPRFAEFDCLDAATAIERQTTTITPIDPA